MEYKITRFEEIEGKQFICVNNNNIPVLVEHFFTDEEIATEETKQMTIDLLIGDLERLSQEYVDMKAAKAVKPQIEEEEDVPVEPTEPAEPTEPTEQVEPVEEEQTEPVISEPEPTPDINTEEGA